MSSDPLPYTQVDRAVKPKVALLAGHLGVTPQHAMGSLIEFWDLCAGDQRELEKALESTPPGEEPAVVLEGDDVALRFKLASGHPIEPIVLARLGLLEPIEKRFRVRGMSRYFEPIRTKRERREIAVKAGKASAASRRAAERGAEQTVEHDVEHDVERPAEPGVEPGATKKTSVSSQQTSVSSQQSDDDRRHVERGVAAFHVEAPDPSNIEAWSKEDFWRAAELTRREAGYAPEKWPSPLVLTKWWSEARSVASVKELAMAFQRFAVAKHWAAATPPAPFVAFAAKWNEFLPRRSS